MNGKMRKAGFTAAAALTLSMALAPGFALADSGHHGHGHKSSDHGRHSQQITFQLKVQNTLTALNKVATYYNPLIQADEQKVQTELAAAIQASTAANAQSQSAPVNTSADVTIEQQIQAAITQMSSAQSPQQLLSLTAQVRELSGKLQSQVQQAARQQKHGDDHGKGDDNSHSALGWMNAILHAFGLGKLELGSSGADSVQSLQQMQAKLQAAEGRYAALYARVQTALQSGGSAQVSSENERSLWSLLHSYERASAALLRGLMNIDNYLSTQTSPSPSPGSSATTPSATSSVLSVSQGTVTAGQNVTVTGTVYSTANTAMAGIPVTVTVDGVSAQTQTAANGAFSATVQPTTAAVNAPISVVASGTAVNNPQFVLTVNPAAAYSITSSTTTTTNVGASQMSAVTYTVKDQYGNVVPNAMVDFSIRQAVGTTAEAQAEVGEAAGSLSVLQLQTGSNGQATVDYTSSSTADNDNDVVDSVVATVAGTNVSNSQAQFAY